MAKRARYDRLFLLEPDFDPDVFTCSLGMSIGQADAILHGRTLSTGLSARWKLGPTTPGDFGYVMESSSFIVSGRVLEEWRRLGFTGWSSVPCIVSGRGKRAFPDFHFLVVTGRCAPVDFNRGKLVDVQFPYGTLPMREGLFFEADSWDGSDVFMAPNYGAIFVTDRVRKSLARLSASAVSPRALSSYQLLEPGPPIEILPGRRVHRRVLH
jgi:hypothetical protein